VGAPAIRLAIAVAALIVIAMAAELRAADAAGHQGERNFDGRGESVQHRAGARPRCLRKSLRAAPDEPQPSAQAVPGNAWLTSRAFAGRPRAVERMDLW
jgi:hypothetical protein